MDAGHTREDGTRRTPQVKEGGKSQLKNASDEAFENSESETRRNLGKGRNVPDTHYQCKSVDIGVREYEYSRSIRQRISTNSPLLRNGIEAESLSLASPLLTSTPGTDAGNV